MFDLYMLTGATGFLGSTVLMKLLEKKQKVRILAVPNDSLAVNGINNVDVYTGYVDQKETLSDFFSDLPSDVCLIHCAGIISISTKHNERINQVNVMGTRNILDLANAHHVKKFIYVSSVHAIPVQDKDIVIKEISCFSAGNVIGQYAKSKAEATAIALEYVKKGLDVSIVHPSGIIGPGDKTIGNISNVIIKYCNRRLPCSISGGYDFVDVRDVADGILSCCEHGRNGECYILSNTYVTIDHIFEILSEIMLLRKPAFTLPFSVLKMLAPLAEITARLLHKTPFLTPYSVYTMQSPASFSHEKASNELLYKPKSIETTLNDTVSWLVQEGMITKEKK